MLLDSSHAHVPPTLPQTFVALARARPEGKEANMKKKTKAKGKVVKFTARRREAIELVKFIDAHGGRLGAFRGYGAALRSPSTSPPPPPPTEPA
jgi:hypothetical protein